MGKDKQVEEKSKKPEMTIKTDRSKGGIKTKGQRDKQMGNMIIREKRGASKRVG